MDSTTLQYMVGSPVTVSISPNPADHLKKWRSVRSNYSLADIHMVDDRGTNLLLHGALKCYIIESVSSFITTSCPQHLCTE